MHIIGSSVKNTVLILCKFQPIELLEFTFAKLAQRIYMIFKYCLKKFKSFDG